MFEVVKQAEDRWLVVDLSQPFRAKATCPEEADADYFVRLANQDVRVLPPWTPAEATYT